jgi:hypothetical protein
VLLLPVADLGAAAKPVVEEKDGDPELEELQRQLAALAGQPTLSQALVHALVHAAAF